MGRPIGLSRAVWEGGAWAIADVFKRRRGNLAELEPRNARIAAIVVRCAIEAGILVLVDTSPELVVLKLAVDLMRQARR